MERENLSYIFGFIDINGDPYDFHISDDLQSKRTWESIDFKFSLPESKYILVWKRDRTKFTRKEANHVFDYVKEDMDEYMDNVKFSNEEDTQSKITNMLTPTKDCLIIAYDRMILPEGNINWKNYSDMISIYIDEMIEESIQGLNDSEQIENILEGKEAKNPILENFQSRTVRYEGFQKPSEKILVNIFEFITNQNFEDASLQLSGFYEIPPPKIKIQTDLVNSDYVFYDVVNTTLFLDISKIPEFWQQLPSFFMGFFCHLSLMRNWSYGNSEESIIKEKREAEKFCNECIQNLIRLNLDPRKG